MKPELCPSMTMILLNAHLRRGLSINGRLSEINLSEQRIAAVASIPISTMPTVNRAGC